MEPDIEPVHAGERLRVQHLLGRWVVDAVRRRLVYYAPAGRHRLAFGLPLIYQSVAVVHAVMYLV